MNGNTVDLFKKRSDKSICPVDPTENLYEVIEKIVNQIGVENPELIKTINQKNSGHGQVELQIEKIVKESKLAVKDMSHEVLIKEVKSFVLGYAVLQTYIDDERVSNIFVNTPDDVWIQKDDQLINIPIDFGSKENLLSFVRTIPAALGGEINRDDCIKIFTDPRYKLRILLGIDPIHHISPCVVIRKHKQVSYSMEELCEMGMISPEMKTDLFDILAEAPVPTCIGGRGGVGKTTFLRAFCEKIPPSYRMLLMEEYAELYLKRRNTIQQSVRRDSRAKNITLSHLADYGNLAKIDIYTFGEVRGNEALPFFDGAFAGNITLNTTHSASARHSVTKLAINMQKGGTDIPFDVLQKILQQSIRVLIQMDNFKVTEVVELFTDDDLNTHYNTIYQFVTLEKTTTSMNGYFMRKGDFKSPDLQYLNPKKDRSCL